MADKTVLLVCAWAAMAGSPLVMAAYERGGRKAAREEARGLASTLLLIGMPAAVGLALVARPLAEAMIGEAVREQAMQIIPWIAFAGLAEWSSHPLFFRGVSTRQENRPARAPDDRSRSAEHPSEPGFAARAAWRDGRCLCDAHQLRGRHCVVSMGRPQACRAANPSWREFAKISLACAAMWPAVSAGARLGKLG